MESSSLLCVHFIRLGQIAHKKVRSVLVDGHVNGVILTDHMTPDLSMLMRIWTVMKTGVRDWRRMLQYSLPYLVIHVKYLHSPIRLDGVVLS